MKQATRADVLAPLRSKSEKALKPLRETRSNETDKSDEHAAKLPEALKSFTPLASEPEIEDACKGLHELELAVARSPASEASIAALQSQLDVLAERTRAKIASAPPSRRTSRRSSPRARPPSPRATRTLRASTGA